MEFMTVRELRTKTGQVWGVLEKEKDLVITSNGRPIALLTDIASSNLEEILAAVRRARGEWVVRQMRRSAKRQGLDKISVVEIEKEIRKSRREKRR